MLIQLKDIKREIRDAFSRRYPHLISLYQATLVESFPEVYQVVLDEIFRQTNHINLIASECLPSEAVMSAIAAINHVQTIERNLSYSDEAWFPQTGHLDKLEQLACSLASNLFRLPAANVQPHSATQANQAAMLAVLNPGDCILTMNILSGGHLSHGYSTSFAKRLYRIASYNVDPAKEELDYEHIRKRILEEKPKLVISGTSSYPRAIDFSKISAFVEEVGALHLADISHIAGLVRAGLHPSVESADFATMSLHKTMCGPRSGVILCKAEHQEKIDLAVYPGVQSALLPNMVIAKAVSLIEAESEKFVNLQVNIKKNAATLAGVLRANGIRVITNGTDTHLVLIKVPEPHNAKETETRLCAAGILCNRNCIPGDSFKNGRITGIRFGTIWVTQVGFNENDVQELGQIIVDALNIHNYKVEEIHHRSLSLLLGVLNRQFLTE